MWHEALDKRQSVRTVFVGSAKAFDHADHAIILHNLHDMGAPEFVIRWIHSFLSDRQQRVKIDDVYYGWLKLKGGIPQGSWLGP